MSGGGGQDAAADAPGAVRWTARDRVLALGLAVALSPGLYDLLRHWWLEPWSRYSALFLVLTGVVAARAKVSRPLPALGFGALAGGLLLQGLAVLAVMPSLGRPAVVVAFVGFALSRGWLPPGAAGLALFVVPVPYQLTDWTGGDQIAPELFRAAARLVRVLGVGVAAGDRHVISGDADFAIDSTQGGLPSLFALTGLAAFVWLHVRPAPARLVRWWLAIFAGGAAAHFAAVVLACLAIAAGRVGLAGFCVDTLSWGLPALAVWVAVARDRGALSRRP